MADSRSVTSRLPHWLIWLAGAVTVLAAALLILAVVLGIRAGQRQLEIQSRQQIGIHLQRAIDLRADGDLAGSLAEYQQVLILDPANVGAVQGIESLLQIASGDAVLQPLSTSALPVQATPNEAAPSPVAASPLSVQPAFTPRPTEDPIAQLWANARSLYAEGDWQGAADVLLELEETSPGYGSEEAADLLYNSYVNLAAESDQVGRIEEALAYVDKALELRPDALPLRKARTMASTYLDVLSVLGADWPRAIDLLEELYAEDPDYRDVETRLQDAYASYGDLLSKNDDWCDAVEQYLSAIEIESSPDLFEKRNAAQTNCGENGAVAAAAPTRRVRATTAVGQAGAARLTPLAATESSSAAAPTDEPSEASVAIAGTPPGGRILYAASNPDDRRSRIFAAAVGNGSASMFVEDGAQPALRDDGKRVVYYNTRADMAGLTSYDPETGLTLRFTRFAEDTRPSWSPDGNRIVFASNREGDRRWRIYVGWAETDGEVVSLGFGDSAAWHPSADRIAFHGCDASGNGCGLWRMDSGGGNRSTLTSNPADITPAWSSDGQTVVFASNGRHSNAEVYAINTASKEVTRLTDHPANDGAPTVSPDGTWVAFLSDRGGRWQIWGVPINGGEAVALAEIDGNVGNWLEQQLQWVN